MVKVEDRETQTVGSKSLYGEKIKRQMARIGMEAHHSPWKDLGVLAVKINRKFVFAKVCEHFAPFLTLANIAKTPLESEHASSKVFDISLKNGKQVQLQLTLCII